MDAFFSLSSMITALLAPLLQVVWESVGGSTFSFGQFLPTFSTQFECDPCPGASFTVVGAAWANIAYFTHADLLHYVSSTKFGLWAPMIYACAAIGALIAVAIGVPPRTYMWFMLGPAIYSFLINTTQEVKGVDWVVAGRPQDMKEVWRDAEVGMANVGIVKRLGITVNKVDGPSTNYKVATVMLFLDELFSTTTNMLIEWTGLYSQEGDGAANSNLVAKEGEAEGPWYLLSNLKWGMIENIVGVSLRNPDIRDAFITFLGSECGDKFKQAINSGAYMAASQSKGATMAQTVFKQESDDDDYVGEDLKTIQYDFAIQGLDVTSMPTPRSLVRVFRDTQGRGSFGKFAPQFADSSSGTGGTGPVANGRLQSIVCTEYLYTIIQAFRWETGHAYWQLVRSSPNGFNRKQFLNTLFYGWDIRKDPESQYASSQELAAFVKQLTFVYMLRNELLYAPQITPVDQRYAPAEQAKSYTQAYVRTSGSKSKFGELYNWAIMMPHIQGVLLYLIIVAYPFAAMLMVLPGHWKAFFTWISFFAWVKLWDVGFAMVQVLERSVWAMIGNHSNMGRTANMLIDLSTQTGTVQAACAGSTTSAGSADKLGELCAVPTICGVTGTPEDGTGSCTGQDQNDELAWSLLDRSLLLSASADLDLSNGYYVYIMAALYFAVPAVTGQLVLGAKAGASGMVSNMIGGTAGEAGRAAATGYQHGEVNKAMTNQNSLGQAAWAKSMRQGGLAQKYLDTANQALDHDANSGLLGATERGVRLPGELLGLASQSRGASNRVVSGIANSAGDLGGIFSKALGGGSGRPVPGLPGGAGTGAATGAQPTMGDRFFKFGGSSLNALMGIKAGQAELSAISANAYGSARAADLMWNQAETQARKAGLQTMAGRNQHAAQFEADSAAWEAKNAFASHTSAQAGIAGMNTGSLNPGYKPQDMEGMAMSGQLGRGAQASANYAGSGYQARVQSMFGQGRSTYGGSANYGKYWGANNTTPRSVWGEMTDLVPLNISDPTDLQKWLESAEASKAGWKDIGGALKQKPNQQRLGW